MAPLTLLAMLLLCRPSLSSYSMADSATGDFGYLKEGFGSVTCMPGEYSYEPDYEDKGWIESGWGNCHEVETGPGSDKKFCFKAQINGTDWDWRCACSTTWPLIGDGCDEMSDVYWVIQFTWLISLLYNLYLFVWSRKVVKTMFKFSDNKVNAANLSATFMCALTLSEFLRFLTWMLRAVPGSYGDEVFRPLQIFVSTSAFCVSEGIMGLALAWLDIAVKSSSMGKGKIGAYHRRKKGLKLFMWLFLALCVYFFAVGRASMTGAIGVILLMTLAPSLYVGGKSLRKLLQAHGDPPKHKDAGKGMDLKYLIWRTSTFIFIMTPIFVISAVRLLQVRETIKQYGRRDKAVEMNVLMLIWSCSMSASAHSMLIFFDETNKRKIEKMKSSKKGAKQFVKGVSSLFGSTKKSKQSSAKSRKSTQHTQNSSNSSQGSTNGSSLASSTASSTASSSASGTSFFQRSNKNSSSVMPSSSAGESSTGSSFISDVSSVAVSSVFVSSVAEDSSASSALVGSEHEGDESFIEADSTIESSAFVGSEHEGESFIEADSTIESTYDDDIEVDSTVEFEESTVEVDEEAHPDITEEA